MNGKTIAQYRIVEELGKGGMGSVYKAIDTQLDRTVVLKLLSRDLLKHEKARARFLREARLASGLDHPNICTIFEIQETEGYYFISMQYIEGQTLKQAANRRPLANSTLLSVALQSADALAAAHDRGVIHRDIKPQNIMITPRGQVKVLDFGLAKSVNESESRPGQQDLTEHGKTLGTPSYMSPEQARCERIDRRSDVFSFGAVLYEMATGKKAFSGTNNVDILYDVCNTTPPAISDINPRVPPGLQEIIFRAIHKEPGDRYQSMHDLLADLKKVSSGVVGETIPDGIHQPFAQVRRAPSKWIEKLLPAALVRRFSRSTSRSGTDSMQSAEFNRSQAGLGGERRKDLSQALSMHDDFPIIPGQHKSLAVLPFRNLGGQFDETWRISLLEALIVGFAKFKALTVYPPASVAAFMDQIGDPNEIGRQLGVDAVLIGSLIGSGAKLRLTSQLIEVNSGTMLWAGKIDFEKTDALSLQDSICRKLLAEFSGKGVSNPADLLHDENEDVRIETISSLKYSSDPQAVEMIAEALKDESLRVKATAAEALARFGRAAAPAVLRQIDEALYEKEFASARYASQAAGLIGSTELVPVLLEALAAGEPFTACEAAIALGKIRDVRACPELVEALSNSDANVRFNAVMALGQIADPETLGPIELRLRQDDDEGVQAKALWAIHRIRRKPFGTTTYTAVHSASQ